MLDPMGQQGRPDPVPFASATGRWILAATVAASGMAFLDSTAVTVALPAIGDDLGGGVAEMQWLIDGYLLTLASLILLSGALADRYGRRRIFVIGVVAFASASAVCAVAPTVEALVGARLLQGVGGALLTPTSLAILNASIHPDDRSRAIGAWTGLTGVAAAAGPLLGGWVTDAVSWRLVFVLNLPLAGLVLAATRRHAPESFDPDSPRHPDLAGSALLVLALGSLAWGLIESGGTAGFSGLPLAAIASGAALLAAFVAVERRRAAPMVPLAVFGLSQFRAVNAVTALVYAALGSVFFLLVLHLQGVLGYSALEAGAASLPITALMLLLSPPSGALARRIGPRLQLTVGPLAVACAALWLARIDAGDRYVSAVLPPVVLFGLGLAATVAPLTATALAVVGDRHAGVASGVNTAVARGAQLAAIAAVPVLAGISRSATDDPVGFSAGFTDAMRITAGLAAVGAVLALLTVRDPVRDPSDRGDDEVTPLHRAVIGHGDRRRSRP